MSRLPQTTQLIFKIVRSFCRLRIETFSAVTLLKDNAALLGQGAAMDTGHGYMDISSQCHLTFQVEPDCQESSTNPNVPKRKTKLI